MVSYRTILLWEGTICSIMSIVITVIMVWSARTIRVRLGWPIANRWLVIGLFASLSIRFSDLSLARLSGRDPNPPHTILDWALIMVFMVWVARRLTK